MNRISKKNVRNIRITVLFFVFSLVLNWGYKLYMISGDSMSPSVDSSDLVWVSKVKAMSYKVVEMWLFLGFERRRLFIEKGDKVPGDAIRW